ncbi:MAG: SDR family oxidoreductase [Hyphomicrobiales bacterium]|nr:MAG: SDR family oxidoreductase [Hyphomicrobiales bacterium]
MEICCRFYSVYFNSSRCVPTAIHQKVGDPPGLKGLDSSVALDPAFFDRYQPIPRAGTPDDIVAAAAFLASDDASGITGIDLAEDGGLSME